MNSLICYYCGTRVLLGEGCSEKCPYCGQEYQSTLVGFYSK